MKSVEENLAQLPYACYGVLKQDESLILIKKGESGYRPTHMKLDEGGEFKTMSDFADALNDEKRTSKAQRKAMEWGSQFGWGHGLSDASRYDVNGKIIMDKDASIHAVCKLINSKGEFLYRMFGESLAKSWKLAIEHTGTQDECNKFMEENKIQNN